MLSNAYSKREILRKLGVTCSPKTSYSFVFVRDPIQRFISGYSEIESRFKMNKELSDHDMQWGHFPNGTLVQNNAANDHNIKSYIV